MASFVLGIRLPLFFILHFTVSFAFAQAPAPVVSPVCQAMTSRVETLNGRSYVKYNITVAAGMRCPQVQATRPAMPWKVRKTAWTPEDEVGFEKFIVALGKSSCNTVDKCISSEANYLRTEEDLLFSHYSDCADFPYYLRSYYAYKNGLPMSFTTSIEINPLSQSDLEKVAQRRQQILEEKGLDAALKYDKRLTDARYSLDGNRPKSKLNIPNTSGVERDFGLVGPKIMDQVSSGTLRMFSSQPGFPESDFYSPRVSKKSIRPGTVLYNPSGHVAIVYEVTKDGEVLYFDAHPDNSVTRGKFGKEFPLSRISHGGNFKNFRPYEVTNPTFNSEGVIVSGLIRAKSDSQIEDYSKEQYIGNGLNLDGSPNFKINPQDKKSANFYEWVKFKLTGGAYRLDPLFEMKSEMDQLCSMAKDRVSAVQAAIDGQVHLKDHPENLPANIYGTDGDWESYSTPGRDMRLRKKILDIPEAAKDWLERSRAKDPLLKYEGADLKQDLIKIYMTAVMQCRITYRNSIGKSVVLPLEAIIGRVTQLSYDPYSCPEIRWGANTAAELKTCSDDQEKMEWHKLQQFMRNATEKDTDGVHGWSLTDLASMNEQQTVDNRPQDERYKIGPKLEAM